VIERYRAASLDRLAIIRTAMTLLGLLALLVVIFFLHQLVPILFVLGVPVLLLPAAAYASTPLGYMVNEREVIIDRKALRPVRIPLNTITAVHPLPAAAMAHAIRVYGTGGLFGWSGRYQVRGMGTVSMHATSLDRLILIQRRRRRPILISPAETTSFLSGVRRQYETIEVTPRRARIRQEGAQ
jgi:hypothetical protein